MIVVRLMGGLGNQLFQYAAGRQLAERNKTELFIDKSWFKDVDMNDTPRSFELDNFNIHASIADTKLIQRFGGNGFSFFSRAKTILFSGGEYHKAKFYEYGFDKRIQFLKGNYFLKGYFQSEKYFEQISHKIRNELIFRNLEEYMQHPLFKKISTSVSVSLHVRRGDYMNTTAHGFCSKAHYEKAFAHLQQQIGSAFTVFVFSDDLEWVKQEMNFSNAVFVDNSRSDLKNIDLFLMSACKHHIIANSTYSWWAAWLNPSKEKKVLAPEWWTNEHKTCEIDLSFDGMQIIE